MHRIASSIEDLNKHIDAQTTRYAFLSSRISKLHSDDAGPASGCSYHLSGGPARHTSQEVL